MRIETDIKLGFKDVMIRPKRSTLKSRSEVSVSRNFNFLHIAHTLGMGCRLLLQIWTQLEPLRWLGHSALTKLLTADSQTLQRRRMGSVCCWSR